MAVTKRLFGERNDNTPVMLYHLENRSGAYAEVITLGAVIVKVCVPDRSGELRDVVLGYDDAASYEVNDCYFGTLIGPNGNRIGGARFTINGTEYKIPVNENDNNLHSGPNGFEKKNWEVANVNDRENSVTFFYVSPDGENGFPGKLEISICYTFTEDNELVLTYSAVSDKDTVINPTNHSYFNLNGEGSGTVLSQSLMIHADCFTPVQDSCSIPDGTYAKVEGTPLDFRKMRRIGDSIDDDFDQLKYTGGYDHNFVTDDYEEGRVRKIAEAFSEESGIVMEAFSDLPCVQFYAGNFITPRTGKNGHAYDKRHGFCLETQVEPDAVNRENFHSPVRSAGEIFTTVTKYRFSVR